MRVYQTGPVVLVYLKLHMHLTWEKAVAAINEKHQVFTTYRNTQFGINVKRQRGNKKKLGRNKILQSWDGNLRDRKMYYLSLQWEVIHGFLTVHKSWNQDFIRELREKNRECACTKAHTGCFSQGRNTQLTNKAAVRNIRKFHTRKIKLRNHYRYQALLAKLRDSVGHY